MASTRNKVLEYSHTLTYGGKLTAKNKKTYHDNLSFIITEKQLQELLMHDVPIEVVAINRGGETVKISRPWNDSIGLGHGNYFDRCVTAIFTYKKTTVMRAKIDMHACGGGKTFLCFFEMDIPLSQ